MFKKILYFSLRMSFYGLFGCHLVLTSDTDNYVKNHITDYQCQDIYIHGIGGGGTKYVNIGNRLSHEECACQLLDPHLKIFKSLGLIGLNSDLPIGAPHLTNNRKNLSSGEDVQLVADYFKAHAATDKQHKLRGISAGGATAINFLAEKNPNNICSLELDAAVHDIVEIPENWLRPYGLSFPWGRETTEWIVRQVAPGYVKNSEPPVSNIAEIKNKALLVVIVHSKADTTVPFRSALKYAESFKKNGFEHVYLIELEKGNHVQNAKNPDYQQAFHSIHKKHLLSHVSDKAVLTDMQLASIKPTLADIQAKIHKDDEAFMSKQAINFYIASILLVLLTMK